MVNNSKIDCTSKIKHLKQLSEFRKQLCEQPKLHSLFIEMTGACNEHCRHCGSRCEHAVPDDILSREEIKNFLDTVREDYDVKGLRLCITGGEPLLRDDFFEIMNYAKQLGFSWGMTTNGTLITESVAGQLKDAGMKTVSVSLDGLRDTHDWFRDSKGSYDKTVQGISNLVKQGFEHVQITTVVHRRNITELKKMYRLFSKMGVKSWRVINVEPIGRALDDPEILLTNEQLVKMFDFIRKYRFKSDMEVCYGCSHYLGVDMEREVRKWYYLCNAGIYTASVCANGEIRACLDIERRPELIEGNIRQNRFSDVWKNGFKIYRSDFKKQGKCADCSHYEFCVGDAYHSWDYDNNEPLICMKGILFDK